MSLGGRFKWTNPGPAQQSFCYSTISLHQFLHHIDNGRVRTGYQMCKNSFFVQWTSLRHVRVSEKWSVKQKVNFQANFREFPSIFLFFAGSVSFYNLLCWNLFAVLFESERRKKPFGKNFCCPHRDKLTFGRRHVTELPNIILISRSNKRLERNEPCYIVDHLFWY